MIQHNQGQIEGGEKWIAQGLKKLDSEINDERANWMADKLMSTLILVGCYATQYAAGRGLKALKTKIHTTCYRKQYLQKLPKRQPLEQSQKVKGE